MSYTSRLSLLFVFVWSTAFIAFEYCSPYAEPATFVLVRVSLAAAVLLVIAAIFKSAWPRRWVTFFHSAIVGVLIHAFYAGGSFGSIYYGMNVGHCALILSLQPIVTALLSSFFLGEKITVRKVCGVVAGITGVTLIVLQSAPEMTTDISQLSANTMSENNLLANVLCVLALLALSIATIYQKRFCTNTPLVSGAVIQFSAAAIFMLPIAILFEPMQIAWNVQFVLGLGWLVLVLSVGAMFLLMLLIKTQEAGKVANLFLLVTPMVTVEAWILFDEPLSMISVVGMLLCMTGVMVVNSAVPVSVKKTITVAGDELRSHEPAHN